MAANQGNYPLSWKARSAQRLQREREFNASWHQTKTELRRVKFILEDGRKVYLGFDGDVDLFSPGNVPQYWKDRYGGFSEHLYAYYSPLTVETMGYKCPGKIVGFEVENASDPLDSQAYLTGGKRVNTDGD